MKATLLLALAWLTVPAVQAADNKPPVPPLTLKNAEARALASHPRITVAELRTLAAKERVTEARSSFLPTLAGSFTAVDTDGNNNRIAAGGLNNPIIYDRAAVGLQAGWQLFDFGRSANLVSSAALQARAEASNTEATRAQIVLLVDSAYVSALQAQSVLHIAQDTLATRKLLLDQVSVLASNQIKSEMDVSFAQVSVDEVSLLLVRAENDLAASQIRLASLLGDTTNTVYTLQEEPAPAVPADASPLVAEALARRPELQRTRFERDAETKFARAEGALHYPTVVAVGAMGLIPAGNSHLPENYLAGGVNVNVPLFNGGQYEARRKEAKYLAQAADAKLKDEEISVIRDVRTAWLSVKNAAERVNVADRLALSTRQALDLAEARYKAGTTSVAELSQAQLNNTSAEISRATSRYDLLLQHSLLDFQTGTLATGTTDKKQP